MVKRRKNQTHSFAESLDMLSKLQQMAIDEGNLSLALKAEELKCKIAVMQAENCNETGGDKLTKILVDFINERQNSKNTEDICTADDNKISL